MEEGRQNPTHADLVEERAGGKNFVENSRAKY